jgi:hypothetical protein
MELNEVVLEFLRMHIAIWEIVGENFWGISGISVVSPRKYLASNYGPDIADWVSANDNLET